MKRVIGKIGKHCERKNRKEKGKIEVKKVKCRTKEA
jgi:hypothetical protein